MHEEEDDDRVVMTMIVDSRFDLGLFEFSTPSALIFITVFISVTVNRNKRLYFMRLVRFICYNEVKSHPYAECQEKVE